MGGSEGVRRVVAARGCTLCELRDQSSSSRTCWSVREGFCHGLRVFGCDLEQGSSRALGLTPALFPVLQSRDAHADHECKL